MKEIVIYKDKHKQTQIEVKLSDETIWLNQKQISVLFGKTKQNISLHINNCFKEKELDYKSVVKESLTTAGDRKSYKTKYYNLDQYISMKNIICR